ncbi:MAG TPA: hypothetical protein VIV11_27990 [Kofleriaceae bacterium]
MPRAQLDPALSVRVISVRVLRYDAVAPLGDDRPAHVRAASGMAWLGGRLAVIQDDAAFIAYVGGGEVSALALPRGAGGRRRFEVGLGNKMEKLDLEACVAVPRMEPGGFTPTGEADELWAFGSGSAPAREKIAVIGYATRIHDAAPLYRRLREELESDVNIEGVALVADALWLFHRGNTSTDDRGPAVVRLARAELACWLAGEGPVPEIKASERYDLGAVHGWPLGFTDAVAVGARVFYLAAAEASPNAIDDAGVVASQLGVIDGDTVRACELLIDGAPAKAEGLAFDPKQPNHAWLAIDPDDVDAPARLYEIALEGPW